MEKIDFPVVLFAEAPGLAFPVCLTLGPFLDSIIPGRGDPGLEARSFDSLEKKKFLSVYYLARQLK
jgi:hypothetical protein